MNPLLQLLTALAFSALPGCDSQFEQTVVGHLDGISSVAPSLRVKLLSWSENGCQGAGEAAELTLHGDFKLKRMVWRGGIGVIVQRDLLCLEGPNGFIPIAEDKHAYGPAPNVLEYHCVNILGRWTCESSHDGRAFAP